MRYAVPRRLAVAESETRSSGRPVRSAWVCMSGSLPDTPPPTRSRVNGVPMVSATPSIRSHTECAIPSSTARARSARVVARVSPVRAAVASGCQTGVRTPASAGTKRGVRPGRVGTRPASSPSSFGEANRPRSSQSQFSAEPAVEVYASRL